MRRRIGVSAVWLLCLTLGLAARVHAAAGPDSLAARPAAPPDAAGLNAYGISLALAKEPDRAEAAFFSVLSQRRGDGRAYNNLGNLHLMKGDYAVALSYYDSALRADSADAGVHLNRAAVLLLLGDEANALDAAALAAQLAGGEEQAGALLGLREGGRDSSRAAEKKRLSPAEMRALLKKASRAVPPASRKAPAAPNVERGQGKRTPAWRSGTTRATEAPSDAEAATVLYWKR
jgi:tetratricopeptide (TPR) repeat protein